MSTNDPSHRTNSEPQRRVDARTLWAGGLASAVVAALVAVVGVLIFRGVFDVHVLAPFAWIMGLGIVADAEQSGDQSHQAVLGPMSHR